MLNSAQAKMVFNEINKGRGYFDVFYKILSMFNSSIRNLPEIINQIMHVMNSSKPVLFHVKSNSIYEYESWKDSRGAGDAVRSAAGEIEELIDKRYLPFLASSMDKYIRDLCKEMLRDAESSLKWQADDYGKKMFDFQNHILKRGCIDIKWELEKEFKRFFSGASKDIVRKQVEPKFDKQLEQFKKELKKWKDEQLRILEAKLTSMVPNHDYYVIFGGRDIKKISPQTGKNQARELAKAIVELVYEKRLKIFENFRKQPTGGNIGNIKARWLKIDGEMECSDWTALFYQGLEDVIKKYYEDNLNSFRVEWRRRPPFIKFFEHNWIRIFGPKSDEYLVIDPWNSGGEKILGNYPTSLNKLYKLDGKAFAYPQGKNF